MEIEISDCCIQCGEPFHEHQIITFKMSYTEDIQAQHYHCLLSCIERKKTDNFRKEFKDKSLEIQNRYEKK